MKKHLLPFLLAFVLPLVAIYAWWGGFNTPQVSTAQGESYHFAYLEHQGDLSKLPEKQQEALSRLQQQNIRPGMPITVLLNDPRAASRRDRKARTGYVVEAGVKVAPPLGLADIPAGPVLRVTVKAQPLLAPGKAYTALIDDLEARRLPFRLPTVERYQDGVLTVDMPL